MSIDDRSESASIQPVLEAESCKLQTHMTGMLKETGHKIMRHLAIRYFKY
jgi:hypothetical protein